MILSESITTILSIISPVFIIILIGYFAVSFNIMKQSGIEYLSTFVTKFALPSMLFKVISERPITDIFNSQYIFAYTTGSAIAFLFSFLMAFYVSRRNISSSSIIGMGGSISNSGFIGYPIVIQIMGPTAEIPFILTLLIELVIMVPFTLTIADSALNKDINFINSIAKSTFSVLKSPIIVSIIFGMIFSIWAIQPPVEIKTTVNMLSLASGPVALFFIGGSLVGLNINGLKKDIGFTLFGKLIIHPIAVFCTFLCFPGLDPVFRITAVILACSPMFSIFPAFGQKYGLETTCSAILVPTTAASFITISTIIWFVLSYIPLT
jgi:malonate transporter